MGIAKEKWVWAGLAACGALLLFDALFLEKYFFKIKEFQIGNKASRKKLKILLLTDLHFRKKLWPFHYRLARTINRLRPELILVSGDLIDQWGEPKPLHQFLGLLNHSIPKLAIPGNHDHVNKVSIGALRKVLENHNGKLLVNTTQQVQTEDVLLTITGIDDFIEGESRVEDALKATVASEHHFVLIHSPLQQEELLKKLKELNSRRAINQQIHPRYIFAGHTHGGQVRLGPLVPVLPEESGGYVAGWYNKSEPYLYVSKGFGTSVLPLRFGARAELTLFYYGVG